VKTNKRRTLLWLLLIPLVGVLFLGLGIGTIERAIWLALLVAWLVAFFTWAKQPSHSQ
jgi:hypothetical protein